MHTGSGSAAARCVGGSLAPLTIYEQPALRECRDIWIRHGPSSPDTKASAGHHDTLSGGSSGLPCTCASGSKGQDCIPPAEGSDQVHIFPRLRTPLCSHLPGKPPPNLPLGCVHQLLLREGCTEKWKVWVLPVPYGPSIWSSRGKSSRKPFMTEKALGRKSTS